MLVVWWGLVFLFFVAPFSLLAVFYQASAFNQDVSTWNTGAVTTMYQSKCTLSPSLWPRRLPLWCVVEYIYDNSRFVGSQVSHVEFFLFCLWFETAPCCCCLCVVGVVFSLLHPSLFLQCFKAQPRSNNCCARPSGRNQKVCFQPHNRLNHVSSAATPDPV